MKIKFFEVIGCEDLAKEANEFMADKDVDYTQFIEVDGRGYFVIAYKENEK